MRAIDGKGLSFLCLFPKHGDEENRAIYLSEEEGTGYKKILFKAFPKEESTQMCSTPEEFYGDFQILFLKF